MIADNVADAHPARLPSAQILHSKTALISTPTRPPTLPDYYRATRPPAVKQRAVRQVVDVDVALTGAPALPVIVPSNFIVRQQDHLSHPDSLELVAVGGVDLENIGGDVPGRLQCSYDSANNSWRTMSTQLPEFVHHHGVAAIEGRLFVIGE